jgi:hypothetical protein
MRFTSILELANWYMWWIEQGLRVLVLSNDSK